MLLQKFYYIFGLCAAFSGSISSSYAMDKEQHSYEFSKKTLQPAKPLPIPSPLSSSMLSEHPQWQVRELSAASLKRNLSPQGREALRKSGAAIPVLVKGRTNHWGQNDDLKIQSYEDVPEFFIFKTYKSDADWSPIQIQDGGASCYVHLSGVRYDLYNAGEAAEVRTHLASHAVILLPKFDMCLSNNLASYSTLLSLLPIEQQCFKNVCLFPNLFFTEHTTEKQLRPLHTAQKKLNLVTQEKSSLEEYQYCLGNRDIPKDLDSVLLGYFIFALNNKKSNNQ